MQDQRESDFIIVGAGSAGCVSECGSGDHNDENNRCEQQGGHGSDGALNLTASERAARAELGR